MSEQNETWKMMDCPHSAIQMTFTQEELQERAKAYLTRLYGKPGQGNDADKWMERFGLLCGFIGEQFDQPSSGTARVT